MDGCLVMMFLISVYFVPVSIAERFRFNDKEEAKRNFKVWCIMMSALVGALCISLLFQYLRK